jgi:uncharacterized protein (DUF1015 family)
MATIIPFKAIRPVTDKVHLVASRSVDGYNTNELQNKLRENPYTFLHIINPDFKDNIKTKPGSIERLEKIKNRFIQFKDKGIFIQDLSPSYYIYTQIKEGNSYTGIIGCCSIDDYFNGIIKIHEQTITEREQKLMKYLEVCDFNAEPVLFCYPDHQGINAITAKVTTNNPDYYFTTTDCILHKLWKIDNPYIINQIKNYFKEIPSIYIADGHHRSASSALLGKTKREQAKNYTGNEPYNFYLGVFFPESQLKIYDFNRVIKDLNGLSSKEFLEKISKVFDVNQTNEHLPKPTQKHQLSLYLNNKWYWLTLKKEFINDANPVDSLDAALLTKHILSPILNIHDLKTDKRISFISGDKGLMELKKQVDSGKFAAAFALYPVSMEQLKHIADTRQVMPPKSTWIEPKMRSGLIIYSLSD